MWQFTVLRLFIQMQGITETSPTVVCVLLFLSTFTIKVFVLIVVLGLVRCAMFVIIFFTRVHAPAGVAYPVAHGVV